MTDENGPPEHTASYPTTATGPNGEVYVVGEKPVTWSPDDLDRCEHGRHSKDACDSCPNGKNTGNLFLNPAGLHAWTRDMRQRRIGTNVHGEAIFVTYDSRDMEDRP
jgi:hypothetical protein